MRSVVGAGTVPLREPRFVGNEWLCFKGDFNSTFVSAIRKFNKITNAAALITRRFKGLMHKLTAFKNCLRMDLAGARSFMLRLVNIRSSSGQVQTAL